MLLLSMFTGGAAIIDLDTRFDWRVLLFAVSVTMICGLAAGILPALRSTRVAPTDAIKAQSRQVGHAGGRRGAMVGKSLVAAQMAFCLLLLVVAGLFVRSMQSLMQTDVGFDRDRLLVARMDVRSMGYTNDQRQALYDRVLERLRRTPGVASASVSLNGPLGTSWRASSLIVEGYTPAADERLVTNEEVVTADYFETVGLALVEGRGFTPDDARPGSRSTIVNQSMARAVLSVRCAVGKRWTSDGGDSTRFAGHRRRGAGREVHGRARRDAEHGLSPRRCDAGGRARQPGDPDGGCAVRAGAHGPAGVVGARTGAAGLRHRAARPAREPRLDQRSADRQPHERVRDRRAAAGVSRSLRHHLVRRRRRIAELGVRMALGADRITVAWLVVREALTLVGIGAALGLPLAFVAGRSILSLLHGVDPVDPVSYSQATVLLLIVAGVAAYLPAHRASRIDPMVALRSE